MEEGNGRAAALHEEIPLLSFHSMGTSLYDDRGDLFIHRTWRRERGPSLIPLVLPPVGATSLLYRHRHRQLALQQQWAMGASCWGPGPGPGPLPEARAFGL